jgi:phage tail-like protein
MAMRWLSFCLVTALLLLTRSAPSRAATGGGPPPAPSAYELAFDGVTIGFFPTCTGLGSESRPEREEERRKVRFDTLFPDLVCTRGLTANQDLWAWRKQVEQGENVRRDGTITIMDQTGTPLAQWHFSQAWPRKLVVGEKFTEQVSFQYDDLKRVK